MKKYSIIFLSSVLAVSFFSMNLLGSDKVKKIKNIYGRIISVYDKYIELKKQDAELNLYFADDTKVISSDGKEKNAAYLAVCQYARAYYVAEGDKKILKKIEIIKESDCVK